MSTTVYGIPNCGSVKKARHWLDEQDIDYRFIDFKKTPPEAETIANWLQQLPLERLLNKRGTTWRTLTPEQQASAADPAAAVKLMAAQPSLIKRPLIEHNGRLLCGFDEAEYIAFFQAA